MQPTGAQPPARPSRSHRIAVSTITGAMFVLAAAGCDRTIANRTPRLVILYAPCTVSRLHMSPYDETVAYTPSLRRFAARGTVFEKHHTESGQSGIAYASLFSGAQADTHGVFKHPRRLSDGLLLIGEVFAAAGYDTYSWLDQKMASTPLNYGQGVESDHAFPDAPLTGSDPRLREILRRLETDPEYKAFIVTNFTVTHGPYEGSLLAQFCNDHPAECTKRGSAEELRRFKELNQRYHRPLSVNYPGAVRELGLREHDEKRLREINELLYKSDMYRLDRMFGEVVSAVEAAGLFDTALIAFTSDHGEILWRDNALLHWTHGYQLVPEVINISLLVTGPDSGVPVGRYTGVSRSTDVLPTLAGLAGVDPGPAYSGAGTDLSGAVRGRVAPPDQLALSHSALLYAPLRARRMPLLSTLFPSPDPANMWISARRNDDYYKLTRAADGGAWSISRYDLSKDPGETLDLYDAADPDQRAVADRMETYKKEMMQAAYDSVAAALPHAQAVEMLRSMGYVD